MDDNHEPFEVTANEIRMELSLLRTLTHWPEIKGVLMAARNLLGEMHVEQTGPLSEHIVRSDGVVINVGIAEALGVLTIALDAYDSVAIGTMPKVQVVGTMNRDVVQFPRSAGNG